MFSISGAIKKTNTNIFLEEVLGTEEKKEKYKYEGDGCSPIGIFSLGIFFGTEENPEFDPSIEYKKVDENDYWLSENNPEEYNVWKRKEGGPDINWTNYEKLKIKEYKYSAVINYNIDSATKIVGAGSAIFLHVIGDSGRTSGCTATSEENLLKILRWIKKDKNAIIIQAPLCELENMGINFDKTLKFNGKVLSDNVQQVILVTTKNQKDYQAEINTFELKDGNWQQVFESMPAAIGRNGFKFIKNKNYEKFKYKYCIKDTLIKMESGTKMIQEIKIGDKIYSEDFRTGTIFLKEVKKITHTNINTLRFILVDGAKIIIPRNTEFYVFGKGWTEARKIKQGNTIRLSTKQTKTVIGAEDIVLEKPIEVYNIKMLDGNAYFINNCDLNIFISTNKYKDNIIYFSQSDSRWKEIMYSNHNDTTQTIESSGCGPTAMSMVVSTLERKKGKSKIIPPQLASFAVKNNFRTYDNGTEWEFFIAVSKKYNMNCDQKEGLDIQTKQALKNGEIIVISSMKPGHFTKFGHFIVINGIEIYNEKEYYTILDPNSKNTNYEIDDVVIDHLKQHDGKVSAPTDVVEKETAQIWVLK